MARYLRPRLYRHCRQREGLRSVLARRAARVEQRTANPYPASAGSPSRGGSGRQWRFAITRPLSADYGVNWAGHPKGREARQCKEARKQ
jgi:hypothetical protein